MVEKILQKLKDNNIIIKDNIIINDNDETVTSRIDGSQRRRIYGRYLKSLGLTSDEYKILFPNAPLMCGNDLKKTTINSGKHMKQEKYKTMFAEKIKGEKNPNHKNRTTEEQRKDRSPFSENFYKKKFKNISDDELNLLRNGFIESSLKDREFTTRIDYYLKRGYDLETSEKMLKERQQTFTLEKCIKKYGNEIGKKMFEERQKKWQLSLLNNGNLKCGYSEISQILFYDILNQYDIDNREYVYFATKNKEYYLSGGQKSYYQYDFTDLKNKKIIEYNGDEYHANPKLYESTDHPHPFRKWITAQDIWNNDEDKLELAKEKGFDVLVIWDSEYKQHKEKTLKRCLEFLGKL